MKALKVHDKQLPNPSFFQVYNFGGGNGDKDREIVYAEFTNDTPALINYYYINNRYKHIFQSKLFDNVERFNTIGDLYNFIRSQLILNGEIYSDYSSLEYDFNSKVFLLDSGAFNILKYVAKEIDYDISRLEETLVSHMKEYYDFANKLKVDIVVGFDLGGKYTEKDGEKSDKSLVDFLSKIDNNKINNLLLEETVKYLKMHTDYYPYVLATVHGSTPTEYAENTRLILSLEERYNTRFWGFALGGIASYKQVDKLWYCDIDLKKSGKKGFIETITPARASKIVRSLVGERPIHALGCGGYNNILLNYFCGATSFDAASPVRRVGDGNTASTKIVFDSTPSKESFSKYFMGGINYNGTLRQEPIGYLKLNEVPNDLKLCGCPACKYAESIYNIKKLYSMKEVDNEANYFGRQLMGLHAVMQHRKLCEEIAKFDSVDEFCNNYPSELNKGLKNIYHQL